MKAKLKELNVDFIGGQGPLTKEEEKRISEYLITQKIRSKKKKHRITRISRTRKVAG